ncbi:MAG: Heme/hemopexin transporter protein HuxB precursor [Syntrophorhabdaceae bacterium PtaU1.Bin034]|nr:MAG: Heme/hemopexin transporter protein HuxB precursor [Syntrophorhabdaceae bacterium PtaU1.Bin034]
MKKLTTLITTIALLLIITPAYAQQAPVPNIGEALKEAAPPPKEAKEAPPPKEVPVIIQEEKPFSLPEGEKLFIKDFAIEGALKEDEATLSTLLAPYKGRDLTMAEITEAANKVTLYYRDKGYLVARAYVPKQDATSGILTIRIIMGTYGKFSLKNTSHVRDFLIQGVFDRAKKTSPVVTRDSLERAMLLVKDMPGTQLPTVAIAAGEAPGTSDFTVNADKSPRVNGYLMGDNQGSRFTGKNRVYGGIDINSSFGIADKFSVSGMTSNGEGLQNLRIAYGFPLGYTGLRTELAASRTIYELGGIYSDLDAKGSADVVEGTFSYPLRKRSNESIDISLNLAYKKLQDELKAVDSENPRNASVATLSLQRAAYGSLFGKNLFTAMSLGVTLGDLDIRDDAQKALNEAGANTGGTYSKANLAFSGNLALTEKLSVRGSLKLQKSLSGNLDPTEQLFISGISGVKAYTESVSFDNGYVASMETRYALPPLFGITHALGAFIDNGYVYAENGNYTTEDKTMVSDVGLGYYVNFKKMFGSIQLAEPFGGTRNDNVKDPGTRVLAQVGVVF